jgi:hypothetical protein
MNQQSHSATVEMFLHINDGSTFKLCRSGGGQVQIHPDDRGSATYDRDTKRLAIIEIIVDGKSTRKAILIREYLPNFYISICGDI